MIIVVAALRFETKEARDAAVAATADVQLATREEEAGCLDYCFAPTPPFPLASKSTNCGKTVTRSQPIFSIRITTKWLRCFMAQVSSRASIRRISSRLASPSMDPMARKNQYFADI